MLNEETVMPRYAFSTGPWGSVAVMIATGYGTRRINRRTWSCNGRLVLWVALDFAAAAVFGDSFFWVGVLSARVLWDCCHGRCASWPYRTEERGSLVKHCGPL